MHGHTRLIRRNQTYYIRARIPLFLVSLAKTTQYFYSLKTNNYYEALAKLRKESYKIDMKINLLKAVDMQIKNKQLILDDTDIDKLVIHKLKQVEDIFENKYEDILNQHFNIDRVTTFSNEEIPSSSKLKSEYELNRIEIFIKEYFKDLKEDKRTPINVIKQIGNIEKQEIPIIADKSCPEEWVNNTKTALKGIDKYINDKTEAIMDDSELVRAINPRVKRCLKIIEEEKSKKTKSNNIKTPWTKIFKEFEEYKKNTKQTGISTIEQNRDCLETVFEIIGKQYVENITYKDCYTLCSKINNLPKKWKVKYKHKKLKDLLEQENTDKISTTSVMKYLRAFKEFMQFCKKRRYIPESFSDDIELPKRKNGVEVEGFTRDELLAIFNPSFYPKKHNIYFQYRFWIPLIALYTGMRLNEICQLYLDDIKYQNGVWYFSLTDEREKQHLKNPQSKRDVPIHQKLIDFGFIDFVRDVRTSKEQMLFHRFKDSYSIKNHYANTMSGWFARYLKSLNIEGRNKVFHSFRHTVKPYLRDAGISQEYQNAICGWASNDIGERVYGGKIPVKKLQEEISKLQYPFLEKNLKEIMKLNEK